MYSLQGRQYDAGEPGFETALRSAHEASVRPLCMCTGDGIPVYVSTLPDRHTVKRLPFTGALHSPTCPHRCRTDERERLPAVQRNPQTGHLQLRVAFALSGGATSSLHRAPRVRASQTPSPYLQEQLGLSDLLRLLWQEADLMRWHQRFEGKRTWRVVRAHLLDAASRMFVGTTRLSSILYVPESFAPDRAAEIAARRGSKFAEIFGARTQAQRRMLLVGELKRLGHTDDAIALIKHAPDMPFGCNCSPCVHPRFDGPWRADPTTPVQHLMVIATFTWCFDAGARIQQMEVLEMSREWLPLQRRP